ncbi:MAG: TraI domain-containing protein [Cellvibrionaceae bacterium]|nr:TraI domain-containing protein [Cellvibrionaceae bacterium]
MIDAQKPLLISVCNVLFSFFKKPPAVEASGEAIPAVKDLPRYPPCNQGFPASSTDAIVESQHELIAKMRLTLRFTQAEFNQFVLPVIQGYAAYTHLLPASESHHHCSAGGLFHHGLEVALWSAQRADAYQFDTGDTPRQRRENEPRWQFAAFLAGLLHDIGKPLSDRVISDEKGNTWNPYVSSLSHWLCANKVKHYTLRWQVKNGKRPEIFSMMMMTQVLTPEAIGYLNTHSADIMEALLAAVVGTGISNDIASIMLWADQESVRRDEVNPSLTVDDHAYSLPLERFLFDALRPVVASGTINQPGALVWHLPQGVFLVWAQLVPKIHAQLAEDSLPAIPQDPNTLADMLIVRGFATAFQETEQDPPQAYWPVYPEILQGLPLSCLRLNDPSLVFVDQLPDTVNASFVKPPSKAQADNDGLKQDEQNQQDRDNMPAAAEEAIAPAPSPTITAAPSATDNIANNNLANNKTTNKTVETTTAAAADVPITVTNHRATDEAAIEDNSGVQTLVDAPAAAAQHSPSAAWQIIDAALALSTDQQSGIEQLAGGRYGIPYPGVARLLGEPRDIMNTLAEAKLLHMDAASPSKTTVIEGKKYLLLAAAVKTYILSRHDTASSDPQ